MSGVVNGVKVTREYRLSGSGWADASADDPNRTVTVTATSGKTGNEIQISYTNCKVVGNGSFGVVFAAKMLGELSPPLFLGSS